MRHTENRRPQVPVMVGLGVAVWVVLATAFATARHGYYVPAAIEIGVLILAGMQMLALGLLGEMQVRHYHQPDKSAPYTTERVLRAHEDDGTRSTTEHRKSRSDLSAGESL